MGLSNPIFATAEVNGEKINWGNYDGIQVTPEYLHSWLARTPRPEGYQEGEVYLTLSYAEISRLFGPVTVTFSEREK